MNKRLIKSIFSVLFVLSAVQSNTVSGSGVADGEITNPLTEFSVPIAKEAERTMEAWQILGNTVVEEIKAATAAVADTKKKAIQKQQNEIVVRKYYEDILNGIPVTDAETLFKEQSNFLEKEAKDCKDCYEKQLVADKVANSVALSKDPLMVVDMQASGVMVQNTQNHVAKQAAIQKQQDKIKVIQQHKIEIVAADKKRTVDPYYEKLDNPAKYVLPEQSTVAAKAEYESYKKSVQQDRMNQLTEAQEYLKDYAEKRQKIAAQEDAVRKKVANKKVANSVELSKAPLMAVDMQVSRAMVQNAQSHTAAVVCNGLKTVSDAGKISQEKEKALVSIFAGFKDLYEKGLIEQANIDLVRSRLKILWFKWALGTAAVAATLYTFYQAYDYYSAVPVGKTVSEEEVAQKTVETTQVEDSLPLGELEKLLDKLFVI